MISTSAPHIYHSALLLSPKNSLVQALYGPQGSPLARVVQGASTSWDPSIASNSFPTHILNPVWSPCSKFITAACSYALVVLDAVTLEQLHALYYPMELGIWGSLMYSPDGHLLTYYSYWITSWDFQTGGLISNIEVPGWCSSITFSGCGTMIGGLSGQDTIVIYNVLSGTQISSHSVQGSAIKPIWTCGEYLQFATIEPELITIWEVSFTSSHTPTQISSLPVPDYSSRDLVFFPTLSQLAFILEGRVLVWDAQHQKILLDSMDVENPTRGSFSPNGHFFMCCDWSWKFHLWKKSPDGYLPHQKFPTTYDYAAISPNGELIISSSGSTLKLWHITNSPTSLSIPVQAPKHSNGFLLEFSPDGSLVVFAQRWGITLTVLDVNSGNPQLVIDAGTMICGMGITGSKIIIVGDEKFVTWELPAEDCGFSTQWNTNNSVCTTAFEHQSPIESLNGSISPHFNYAAILDNRKLAVYNMHTGEKLAAVEIMSGIVGFTPNGNEVWCGVLTRTRGQPWEVEMTQWAIVRDDGTNTTKLESLGETTKPLSDLPYHSSCDYQVTDDGWILGSSGKLLLWLPHEWRSEEYYRKWGGKCLALGNSNLTEPVILELEV